LSLNDGMTKCVKCLRDSVFVVFAASRSGRLGSTRRRREGDLAYLAALPADQAQARRFVHEAHRDLITTARAVAASRREGRAQRRGLPKVQPMKVHTAAMAKLEVMIRLNGPIMRRSSDSGASILTS
jgi:hypothetical protein